jgi:hypothetical protein
MIVFGTPAELQHVTTRFALERLEHFVSENQKMFTEEERVQAGIHRDGE